MAGITALVVGFAGVAGACAAQQGPVPDNGTGTFLTVSGQVVDALQGGYVLRHGGGVVGVNFAGWPRELPGDQAIMGIGDVVTVTGRMDPEFVRTGSLDAVAVFVEDRRAYFALGAPAARSDQRLRPMVWPGDGFGGTGVSGTVVALGGDGFTLDAGGVEVAVDTGPLVYNPYDGVGAQQLRVDDLVHVSGDLSAEFTDTRTIRAERVTTVFVISASG